MQSFILSNFHFDKKELDQTNSFNLFFIFNKISNLLKFKKHKRIYYVPGIISLILIPLVLWSYGTKYMEENDFRVIGYHSLPKDYFKEYPEENYKIGYNYNEIVVPINFSKEIEKEYFNLIKELQENNVDKTGIKFQLCSNHTYGDFMKFQNLMMKTDQGRYSLDLEDDNFYVIHHKTSSDLAEIPFITCGLIDYEDRSKFEIMISDFKEFIQNIPKFFYPILIGYFILVICAIFRPKIFIPISLKT